MKYIFKFLCFFFCLFLAEAYAQQYDNPHMLFTKDDLGALDKILVEEDPDYAKQNFPHMNLNAPSFDKNSPKIDIPQSPDSLNSNNKAIRINNTEQSYMQSKFHAAKNNNLYKNKMGDKVDIDKLLANNYKNFTPLSEYYDQIFYEYNSHLPPTYFKSYFHNLAYNSILDGNLGQVRYFIDQFSMQQKVDKKGNSMLHVAVMASKYDIVRVLLSKNFSVDSIGYNQRTPLHYATIKSDYDMVKILLTMDANLNLKDKFGLTPMDYANNKKNQEIINLFNAYTAN